ncbi:MAG: site-2 protease family protein [Bacilli bacterium]|nr:site-2 protease family protein [Bacilli bacterium]
MGLFKEFIIFSLVIFIHEWGHLMAALYFNWRVDKVLILPFGGLTIFKENINKPIYQELIIALSGPLMQIIFYFMCCKLGINTIFLTKIHYSLLLFNLLPIHPLDGSKIMVLLFNYVLPFKLSHYLLIYISFFSIILLMIMSFYLHISLIVTIIISFILYQVYKELKKHPFYFNKFLFERYLYSFSFKKKRLIRNKSVDNMYRDYEHLFLINKNYYTEKQLLRKRFDFKDKV